MILSSLSLTWWDMDQELLFMIQPHKLLIHKEKANSLRWASDNIILEAKSYVRGTSRTKVSYLSISMLLNCMWYQQILTGLSILHSHSYLVFIRLRAVYKCGKTKQSLHCLQFMLKMLKFIKKILDYMQLRMVITSYLCMALQVTHLIWYLLVKIEVNVLNL